MSSLQYSLIWRVFAVNITWANCSAVLKPLRWLQYEEYLSGSDAMYRDCWYLTPPFHPSPLSVPLSSTLFRPKAANMSLVPFWSTSSQEPWTRCAPAHSDNCSGLTTLSLVSGQQITLNQLDTQWKLCVSSRCRNPVALCSVQPETSWQHCVVSSTRRLQPFQRCASGPCAAVSVWDNSCSDSAKNASTRRWCCSAARKWPF